MLCLTPSIFIKYSSNNLFSLLFIMFETMKVITKVNSANRTVIFIDWFSRENKRAWETDFNIVSRVKNTDEFLSMFSIKAKVNTSGILISKRINNIANIINDKRDINKWLWNINCLQPLIKISLICNEF